MPTPRTSLFELHATYAKLAAGPAKDLTIDQLHGLEYYFEDIGAGQSTSATVVAWVGFVHDVDDFVKATGHLPRADPRRPRPRAKEQRLVDQLAYQRRPAVRAAHREYQALRLQTVVGFEWEPQKDRWAAALDEHQTFWESRGEAPRRRSADPVERTIARWVAHQRALASAGHLDRRRHAALLDAHYRVL